MKKPTLLTRLFLYAVVGLSAPFVIVEGTVWRAHWQFNQRTSDEKLLGKTPDQVIQLLGKPESRWTYSDGSYDFVYEGEYRAVCKVYFSGGLVVKVVHLSG